VFPFEKVKPIIEEMIKGKQLPSVRALAKRLGCGRTKASERLREWKAQAADVELKAQAEAPPASRESEAPRLRTLQAGKSRKD
jgi:DNA-binding transcriptional regulator YhcF (GntR family)